MVQKKDKVRICCVNGFRVQKTENIWTVKQKFTEPKECSIQAPRSFEVSVTVYLDKSPQDKYIAISAPNLGDARGYYNDPMLVGSTYPFNNVNHWEYQKECTNSKGEVYNVKFTFLNWLTRLKATNILRPKFQDRNGGKSPHQMRMEGIRQETSLSVRYNK